MTNAQESTVIVSAYVGFAIYANIILYLNKHEKNVQRVDIEQKKKKKTLLKQKRKVCGLYTGEPAHNDR